ncbi:NADH-quinone oxidoreductase subunit M [Chitinivorax sp. PXF-14]|uniref:NADH-quinone oxidoreductase subunit M n=1 Tax=Chitinivorax sp. PXF-14 TaxID=3230488 RepID=UPI00346568D9
MSEHLLSLVIWTPIIAGVLVLATGGDRNAGLARWIALIGAAAGFLLSLPLYTEFQSLHGGMQFEEMAPWISRFNINYHLGVDGISMLFVVLNSFTTLLVVIAGWEVIERRVAQYFAAFLIMSGLINGSFASLDAILFYAFFEAMLIPMYLIIGVWGGPNRVYAAVKFFLYTLMGSLLMLVAFIYLYIQAGNSFSILDYHNLHLPLDVQKWLFVAFFLSFAVKVPMWPVHTWLPDAHVEAPTGGSMVLAAITLKLGAYGFLRFSLPIAPDASHALSGVMIFLSLVAVVYIGLVALVQADMKKLVAYSSIAHMGFVTLGLFMFSGDMLTNEGVEGALIQMLSHGFVSAAMFACIGVMYDRMHSRQIADYGGVVNTMPKFAAFMMLFGMANAGLPATSGFVGEFLVIMGAVKANFWYAFLAATTLIFGAAYTLWMYKRVIFGDVANEHVAELTDINGREFLLLAVLAVTVLGMGLYPEMFISKMHASVNDLIAHVARSKI